MPSASDVKEGNTNMEKKIAIWGTGNYFNQILKKAFRYLKIDYFIDSNIEKAGKMLTQKNIECILPAEIKKKNIDLILIAVIDNKKCNEITRYLEIEKIKYDFLDYYIDNIQIQKDNNLSIIQKNSGKLHKVIFIQIPTLWCNLRCSYCYLLQNDKNVLNKEKMRYPHKPNYIAKALSYNRMGGMTYFDLTSFGETFLYKDIVELTKYLLQEGHIVSITTNGTIQNKLKELLQLPDELLENLFIRFSFHYDELKKKKLISLFFDNVRNVQKTVASMTVMMVAEDNYLPYKNKIKELFIKELGALPQLDFARESTTNDYKLLSKKTIDEYMQEWSDFESEKFNHRKYFFERKITERCHAGECCSFLNIFTGELYPCSQMPSFTNIYDDITDEIQFKEFGYGCPCEWCINSIMWGNFGAIESSYKGPGYAKILNRIDTNGKPWIKDKLYQILNQRLI